MRGLFLLAIVLGVLVGGTVAAVRVVTGDSEDTADLSQPAKPGSAAATAQDWATAWAADDIDALYQLLSPASRQAVPLSAFQDHYAFFASELTLSSLTATVTTADEGIAELAVRASTGYFGDLEYSTSLNLVEIDDEERWLVDWSPTAIHPDLANGQTFKSTIQRPTRGAILDRNGQALAVSRDVRMLGLNRALVDDRGTLTAALVEFGFSPESVNGAFDAPGGLSQRVAVGPIPDEKAEAAATQLLNLGGVLIYFEVQRVHPLGEAGAHVIGYTRELTAEELAARRGTGARIGDRVGAVGLEASLDERLAGKVGARLFVIDNSGNEVKTVVDRPYVEPEDVATTLDANVLVAAQARLGGRSGAAVVMEPVTNQVLAIVSSPSFHPDAFERNDATALAVITSAPNGPLANRASEGLYSAGSVFKLITGAAGLVYGGYSVTDTIYCGATWDGVDPPRRNWEGAQGPLTIAGGLGRSCNPVFYEIGLKLYDTDNLLSEMARKFGFGSETGIAGLYEEEGLVPDAQWKSERRNEPWYPGDDVNLSIGQGDLLITPLQLANAYTAFLSRQLRTPVLLAGEEAEPRGDIPLSDAQWSHLMQGLQLVTGPGGTAAAAFANAGYTNFAGKSGTAEDSGEQQHVLFVALAPASAPAALAAVVLDEGESGSDEAGPMARDIVLAALP